MSDLEFEIWNLKLALPKRKITVMAAIKIQLNGETRDVPAGIDLDRLLELFSLPGQRVAIELNNMVIRRADWPGTTISDQDKIEVVHFVGGG